MHMSDALVSPAVAGVTAIISISLISIAILIERRRDNLTTIPLMGVMGAFLFVAQMLNFAIPGTGSSGHIIGGILIAAVIGPWRAFLTITAVLVIQCLLFADGGILALGCNIINMGAISTLVAYPFIFKPLAGRNPNAKRVFLASILSSVFALTTAAFLVVVETSISGITLLPFVSFFLLMVPIHLIIGAVEGVATASVLTLIQKTRPVILDYYPCTDEASRHSFKTTKWVIAAFIAFVLIGATWFYRYASSSPDGLEWSISGVTDDRELAQIELMRTDAPHKDALRLQSSTAIMPDYDNKLSGLVGCGVVLLVVSVTFAVISSRRKRLSDSQLQ